VAVEERLALQLIENALRADLTPIEQARAYRRLLDAQGWSARQLAAELAIVPSTVTRALTLLELPTAVQDQVDQGKLAAHLAHEVARLERPEDQAVVAQAVVEGGLTKPEVDELVRAVKARRLAPAARPDPVAVEVEPGVVVKVTWRRAGALTAVQALKKATKILSEQAHGDQAA
jgi:ParB family chromosome partitioning protein